MSLEGRKKTIRRAETSYELSGLWCEETLSRRRRLSQEQGTRQHHHSPVKAQTRCRLFFFSVVARMLTPSVLTMMDCEHASLPVVAPHGDDDSDARVPFAVSSTKMEVAAALHHTARQRTATTAAATQTMTYAATATSTSVLIEHVAPAPAVTVDELAPVMEHVAPAPAATADTFSELSSVIDYVAPTPVGNYAAPASMTEYMHGVLLLIQHQFQRVNTWHPQLLLPVQHQRLWLKTWHLNYITELPKDNKKPFHCEEAPSSTGQLVAMKHKEQFTRSLNGNGTTHLPLEGLTARPTKSRS